MDKHTNPFVVISEAFQVLSAHGVSPLADTEWQKNILTIDVARVYPKDGDHFYKFKVHLNSKGFDQFLETLKTTLPVNIGPFYGDSKTIRYAVIPSEHLEIFKIEDNKEGIK